MVARSWRFVPIAWHAYHFFGILRTRYWRVMPVFWHSYRFFGIIGVYVIDISSVLQYQFLLINSSYLRCRCNVTCFNLDKLQEWRPLGVGGIKIRSYTRNYIIYWDDRSLRIRLGHILEIILYIGMFGYSISRWMDLWLADFYDSNHISIIILFLSPCSLFFVI